MYYDFLSWMAFDSFSVVVFFFCEHFLAVGWLFMYAVVEMFVDIGVISKEVCGGGGKQGSTALLKYR